MKLKDIVNRDLVTLTNCETEPIHIPGAIQPHGFLLGLKEDDLLIDFCSANSAHYCGATHEQLLGKTFAAAFGAGGEAQLLQYIQSDDFRDGDPVALQLGATAYSCTVRRTGEHLLLEAEPFPDGFRNLPDLYRQTRKFVSLLERAQTLKQLCQTIAAETRSITGYDRVMIYRFDKAYNGEVIAEDKRDDLEPFLNLHYPHTDIPAQARELYLRNLLRMIVDVSYTPVPIYTIDDAADKNLDLSHSVLRSVSPIHIEYLKNMGVGATLTISLIHEKKLWGLIACHHYSPKNIPHYTRLSAQLQGHFLTSQVSVRGVSEAFEAGKGIALALEDLLRHTTSLNQESIAMLIAQPELLQIAGASGVALKFDGQVYMNGRLPGSSEVEDLGQWLATQYPGGTFATANLASVYAGAASADPSAAGLLYRSLAADSIHYIIWFRQEQTTEVLWAGDPTKAIVKDAQSLSPRKSFEQWKEQTILQSKDWSAAEQAAAASFAHALQKQLSLILLNVEEQRYRRLAGQLRQANAELENINWISTHDLQEPLRKIRVFASRVLDSDEAGKASAGIIHAVQRMSDAANRMQTLMTDIHTYSRFNHEEALLKPVSLNEILDDVLLDLGEELDDKHAVIRRTSLPGVAGATFLLRQLFTNILRNALKFTRTGEAPRISISAAIADGAGASRIPARVEGYHKVSVADNGIGFSNEYADAIFGLFKRLHTQATYPGTGIGLAICRKIMLRHNGFITAEGVPGAGAVFHLWFPASAAHDA